MFYQALETPNKKNVKTLDTQFKEFYRFNKIIRYLSGLIRRYPIDYDKKRKLRDGRFPLVIDKTIMDNKTGSKVSLVELIHEKIPVDLNQNLIKEDGLFTIENEELNEALKELNSKQCHILFLYYEEGLTNKEIAKIIGQTEQNISYWHKKTIKHLKDQLIKA